MRWIRSGGGQPRFRMCSASGSCYSSTISQASAMRTWPRLWDCPLGKCNAGGGAGPLAISASGIIPDAARSRLFPPTDHALVTAMACEAVAETELPISRQSVADLTSRARKALGQVEIYFSIIQRKVLTPNDFANLKAIRLRLALYEELTNRQSKPFVWRFTRQDLMDWLKRASPHFLAASAA